MDWEIFFKGRLFIAERNEKGWERVSRPPGLRLLLRNSAGKILLTTEYRSEYDKEDIRLPGGKVFENVEDWLPCRENQTLLEEKVLESARMEAKEEAGVEEIIDLSIFTVSPCGTAVGWDLYYLSGIVDGNLGQQELHDDELVHGIKVGFYTPQEVLQLIMDGKMSEDRTVGVLARILMKREAW